jgi:hypothetical protein
MDIVGVNLFELVMGLLIIYNSTSMEVILFPVTLIVELMDAIYLHNKYSKPCSWDTYPHSPGMSNTQLGQSPENSRLCVQELARCRYVYS